MKIDNIGNYKNGWLIGNFVPNLFKSEDFEIAHMTLPSGHKADGHFHKKSTEINYIVSGKAVVEGQELSRGDMFVYEPMDRAYVEYLEDTDIIVIKIPSSKDDKFY
jgi:mannose-6-phosphate isomerase-like protein (cupin superfamily)